MSTAAGIVVTAIIFAVGVVIATAGIVTLLPALVGLWSRLEERRRSAGT